MSLSPAQFLATVRESETAVLLIQEGLLALQRVDEANDFYHLPLELLAQGCERLLKLAVAIGRLDTEGSLPSPEEMKRYRHNTEAVLDDLLRLAAKARYGEGRSAVQDDLEFLSTDEELRRILQILSEFGEGGRYFDLDQILDPTDQSDEGPIQELSRVEAELLEREVPDWKDRIMSEDFSDVYVLISRRLTRIIQQFARAICRMFTLGLMPDTGPKLLMVLTFGSLQDDALETVPKPWYAQTGGA